MRIIKSTTKAKLGWWWTELITHFFRLVTLLVSSWLGIAIYGLRFTLAFLGIMSWVGVDPKTGAIFSIAFGLILIASPFFYLCNLLILRLLNVKHQPLSFFAISGLIQGFIVFFILKIVGLIWNELNVVLHISFGSEGDIVFLAALSLALSVIFSAYIASILLLKWRGMHHEPPYPSY